MTDCFAYTYSVLKCELAINISSSNPLSFEFYGAGSK
jgi:hypothetical protein